MPRPERKVPPKGIANGPNKIHCNNNDNILDLIDFKRFSKIVYVILDERECWAGFIPEDIFLDHPWH